MNAGPPGRSRGEDGRSARDAAIGSSGAVSSCGPVLRTQAVSRARNYAEEALSLAPSEWVYHYLLGSIAFSTRQWQQARSSLETAVQLNPGAPEAHNALGEVWLERGDRERAIASFQRAAELDPKEQAYRLNLEAARRIRQ